MKFLASLSLFAAMASIAVAAPAPQGSSGARITIHSEANNEGASASFSNDGSCHTLPGNAPIRSVQISGSVQGCGLFSDAQCSTRSGVLTRSNSSVSQNAVAIGCQ
ncbi:hypothetical protein BDW74DRAFT_177911 [Aspergillus multicolor]|uniref:uncharacterized protein n=1 Tax=Aspergillus multicolor TaxID=41759 RepID=UPI003CCE05BA